MIARIWRGVTLQEKGEAYLDYLGATGVKETRATQGNRGVLVFKRQVDGQAEFLFVSFWESWDDIRRFAGEEIEKAVYYPQDPDFLLELEPEVKHYEVPLALLPE